MIWLKNLFNKKYKSLIILIFVFGVLLGSLWNYPFKLVVTSIYQNDYGKHMYRCDSSMRDHFIAKSKINNSINDENIENLRRTEVALIDCHDYDKLRKKLLKIALSSDDLSYMGLKAIEKKGVDIENLVRIHEIRY